MILSLLRCCLIWAICSTFNLGIFERIDLLLFIHYFWKLSLLFRDILNSWLFMGLKSSEHLLFSKVWVIVCIHIALIIVFILKFLTFFGETRGISVSWVASIFLNLKVNLKIGSLWFDLILNFLDYWNGSLVLHQVICFVPSFLSNSLRSILNRSILICNNLLLHVKRLLLWLLDWTYWNGYSRLAKTSIKLVIDALNFFRIIDWLFLLTEFYQFFVKDVHKLLTPLFVVAKQIITHITIPLPLGCRLLKLSLVHVISNSLPSRSSVKIAWI